MDEISNLMLIRQYDQERACFIKNAEFLMWEIENLAERRPSIVLGTFHSYTSWWIHHSFLGDRIIASDPLNSSNQEYEGHVYKVGAKHVYLKFSLLFHDKYNGEDYSIRVVPGMLISLRRTLVWVANFQVGPPLNGSITRCF